MKKIFSILIAMFIVNIASMAQEQVFSIGTNGDIVTKTKFIEELYSCNYNNVTPCRRICTNKTNVPADLQSAGIEYKDFQSAYFLFFDL